MPATLHGPGEGERIAAGSGSQVLIKATSDDTAGTFFLSETTAAPGFAGPPLHRHERLHDMFYVLAGTLTMNVDGERRELGPGSFACVPPGVAHTFSNPSAEPVRFLNFNTPGGFELYMRELGEAAKAGPLTPEVMGPIASRYDFELA
jgi:mannose-6-phosphate isomerase-like protein (cupin superfamily)